LASTSLLVTPSSFASSCTRALPATALLVRVRPAALTRSTSSYRLTFMASASRLTHDGSTCFRSSFAAREAPEPVVCVRCSNCPRTPATSSGPGTRSALGNARRRSALVRQPGSGCNHAPRPPIRRRRSRTSSPSTTTTRSNSPASARPRQPTQVLTGPEPERRAGTGS
jgi:hypothetical protein